MNNSNLTNYYPKKQLTDKYPEKQINWYKQELDESVINFSRDELNFSNGDLFEKSLDEIGITKDFKYIVWNGDYFPLSFKESFVRRTEYDYGKHGINFVMEMTDIYLAEGMNLTIKKYNHYKKGYVVESVNFNNKTFS